MNGIADNQMILQTVAVVLGWMLVHLLLWVLAVDLL